MFQTNAYKVRFWYDLVNDKPKGTNCIIQSVEDITEYAVGSAWCADSDIPCKATGRKVALTKALSQMNLSKEQRTEIWKQYFSKVRSKG